MQITPAGTITTSIATTNGQPVAGLTCIPAGEAQTGQVMSIVDGTTIKVMLNGLFYTVRYIGIDLPSGAGYIEAASMLNGQLVFGKEVRLYPEVTENDGFSRLLRYVVIDDKLVNLELIRKGLATVVDTPTGFACSQLFLDAEQTARAANLGQWHK
jgi:micrococcal nuclease